MEEDIIVSDAAGRISASGNVAQRLLSGGFSPGALRTSDVLRKNEWIQFDETVVTVARQRLVAVADLIAEGLTYNVANALGTTRVEWETLSDMLPAEVSMAGVTEGQNDRVEFQLNNVPLPIVHKDFHINIRVLEASRKMGDSLDTTQAALSARLVSEKLENMVFNGLGLNAIGGTVYGLTTEPHRLTGALTGNWADPLAVDGTDIVQDIIKMIGALVANNMYGPYALYVPVAFFNRLADDYKAMSDRTILERILAIQGIKYIRGSASLLTTNVVMVQLTNDVIDLVLGLQPMTLQWDAMGGMQSKFKVMAIMVPRVKATQTGQSGVAHYS